MSTAREALTDLFLTALGPVEAPLGLAVSGGGDSVALLCLAVEAGVPVSAVTVDHGLRPEAAAEAAWVARLCDRLGVSHRILHWQGWDGAGNLQDQARRARLRLISDWAGTERIGDVALGHTQDDQAETVLMRLARRAGVDGLSAMAARRRHLGVQWRRPLLGLTRAELRDWLKARGQGWIEDPSNEAVRFDRVKARAVMTALAPLGIDAGLLAAVAAQMAEARHALQVQTLEAARRLVRIDMGDVLIERVGFLVLPAEIRRRLVLAALGWVASAEYGPRAEALQRLLTAVELGQGGTLAGCRLLCRRDVVRITREAQSVAGLRVAAGAIWDRRWRVYGPDFSGLEVCRLGEAGLAACPAWRATGRPRAALLGSPAVWRGDVLVAAPVAREEPAWRAEVAGGAESFFLSILSH